MKKKNIKTDFLKDYWRASNDVAYLFIKKYFDKEVAEEFIDEFALYSASWVDYETRSIIQVNDYFFKMDFMIECLMFSVKKKDMFDYYDYSFELLTDNSLLKEDEKKPIYNLKNWLAINKGYRKII